MGIRGPIPKDADARRRTNSPEPERMQRGTPMDAIKPPPGDRSWHKIAKLWYGSLAKSGQSKYYEASDWAYAYMIAESMSRDLGEQVVGTTPSGQILKDTIPLKGASLAAYSKAFTALLVSEADRRRALIQLEKSGPVADPDEDRADATVTDIAERLKLVNGGA